MAITITRTAPPVKKPLAPAGMHTGEITGVYSSTKEDKQSLLIYIRLTDSASRETFSVTGSYSYQNPQNPAGERGARSALLALARNWEIPSEEVIKMFDTPEGEQCDTKIDEYLEGKMCSILVMHENGYANVKQIMPASKGDQLTREHTGDDAIGQKQRRKLAVAKG